MTSNYGINDIVEMKTTCMWNKSLKIIRMGADIELNVKIVSVAL